MESRPILIPMRGAPATITIPPLGPDEVIRLHVKANTDLIIEVTGRPVDRPETDGIPPAAERA
jgi:hypothetical protein